MRAAIVAIEYFLPEAKLSNAALSAAFPEWAVDKIEEKTGIVERHIAGSDECSSDLGVAAAKKLFGTGACRPADIDYLLFCTQSPDYFLPTTACLVQHRLGLRTNCGALDFNLGCSGFVYGLGVAKGLIETRQAKKVLLVTAETYSKFIHSGDKSVRTIFGDAAAATLVSTVESDEDYIGPFIYGTDGSGANNLIVPEGGLRCRAVPAPEEAAEDSQGNVRSPSNLYMNGSEIFAFTLAAVPKSVCAVLQAAGKRAEDIDLFVFHQASQFMLDHLRKKLKLPEEKFCVYMRHCGNTVSSTIPIALNHALHEGRLRSGSLVMVVGFGVGYSWAASLVRWV